MRRRVWLCLLAILPLTVLLPACAELDAAVEEFNLRATQLAGGDGGGVENGVGTVQPPGEQPPAEQPSNGEPAQPAIRFDLPVEGGSLTQAWGQVYGQPGGTQFEIIANERQVSDFIVERLQASGWRSNVHGGSVTIGDGQIRVDLALENEEGDFGGGTFSFQPTLDESARVRLNPQGGDLRGLRMPGDFTAALGDTVHAALIGAPSMDLSRVTPSQIALEAGELRVVGHVR